MIKVIFLDSIDEHGIFFSCVCFSVCSGFSGRESLTVLWRVVAQQSRLSLTLVGVGIHIFYEIGKTKTKERQRERETEKAS